MDYPTHMNRLIPRLASSYAFHFALQDLVKLSISQDPIVRRKTETIAAGLKSKTSWFATETIQICREACGGKGYLVENQFAALKADSDIFTTFEGDNTVLMQLVAKGVLTQFKQSLHDDNTRAVLSFIFKKLGHTISEYNPINKRNTDFYHLTSYDFIEETIHYRHEKLLMSLSDRIRKYLKRRIDTLQVMLKTQIHMVDMADAYIDDITIVQFRKALSTSVQPQLMNILTKLYQLYGLTTIYQHRGWYLENDYMDGSQSKAIRKIITKLIQDIRPYVDTLVDAFGIPDELLAAPIALQPYS